jgi:hypothetical protein
VTIFAWYLCLDLGGTTGAAYFYPDIQRAMQEAFRRHLNQEPATSSHGNQYPRQYHYQANWLGINRHVNTNNLIEYPLVEGGIFTDGSDAGQDRVIMDATTGTFAGVLTHRGVNNGFRPCLGHYANPFPPPAALYVPPLHVQMPWLAGYPLGPENGGSGGFKKVRAVEIEA